MASAMAPETPTQLSHTVCEPCAGRFSILSTQDDFSFRPSDSDRLSREPSDSDRLSGQPSDSGC